MPSILYKRKSKNHRLLPLSHRVDESMPPLSKKKKTQKKIQIEKKAVKTARKLILDNICESIVTAQKKNNGKTPHNFVHSIVSSHKTAFPWVTRHVINKTLRTYKASVIPKLEDCNADTVVLVVTEDQRTKTVEHSNNHRKKGGRPKGATDEAKRHNSVCIIAAKNEIAVKYSELIENKGEKKRLAKGSLKRIIDEVTQDRDLPEGDFITEAAIVSRLKRGRLVTDRTTGGLYSPLLELEPAAVDVIIQMARI